MSKGKEPYCSNCGYRLTGLVDSSKCPECGKPIVEVLTRPTWPRGGKRYKSATAVFGLPLIHVAYGPSDGELKGRAKGIIAIGDVATGLLAIGGVARGVIALGGVALGVVACGGLGVGLLACLGGMAVGGLAEGGGAVGIVAQGGGAVGVIADGGGAYGYLARGGDPWGTHTIDFRGPSSPRAAELLSQWDWLIGQQPGEPVLLLWVLAVFFATAVLCALVVGLGYLVEAAGRSKAKEFR